MAHISNLEVVLNLGLILAGVVLSGIGYVVALRQKHLPTDAVLELPLEEQILNAATPAVGKSLLISVIQFVVVLDLVVLALSLARGGFAEHVRMTLLILLTALVIAPGVLAFVFDRAQRLARQKLKDLLPQLILRGTDSADGVQDGGWTELPRVTVHYQQAPALLSLLSHHATVLKCGTEVRLRYRPLGFSRGYFTGRLLRLGESSPAHPSGYVFIPDALLERARDPQ